MAAAITFLFAAQSVAAATRSNPVTGLSFLTAKACRVPAEVSSATDAAVASYATLYGGNGEDFGFGIAADWLGNIYITGETTSTDLPTRNALQSLNRGFSDVFVAKISATSGQLDYATYLGGSGWEFGLGIVVSNEGEVLVTGFTTSPDFPVSVTANQTVHRGGEECFLTRLSADGSRVVYSTFLGGGANDRCDAISMASDGSLWLTGFTSSPDFPMAGAAFETYSGGTETGDAFLVSYDADGNLRTSSFLGGEGDDRGFALAAGPDGGMYVVGLTDSGDFPATPETAQPRRGGEFDAFLASFDASGQLKFGTFLGGTDREFGLGAATAADGGVYVAGFTASGDFPVTQGAAQIAPRSWDVFVARVDSQGLLKAATRVGGELVDGSEDGLRVLSSGAVAVSGWTQSPDALATPDGDDRLDGPGDSYVTVLSPDLTAVLFGTYIGGSGDDRTDGSAVNPVGTLDVLGTTVSTDFPTTPGVPQSDFVGQPYDAFVVRLAPVALPEPVDLSARALSSEAIRLTWVDRSESEVGFAVERSEVDSTPADFRVTAQLPPSSTSYEDRGLQQSTDYRYRVRAIGPLGNSGESNVAYATTLAETNPARPPGPWLSSSATPGFVFKVRFSGNGSEQVGRLRDRCIPETVCVAGAILNRSEALLRVIGPRPNGYFWPQVVRFTVAQIEVWVQQLETGIVRYYVLPSLPPGVDELNGMADKEGFLVEASLGVVSLASDEESISESIHSGELPVPATGPLSPPGKLKAAAESSGSVRLSWIDSVKNETGFRLERDSTENGFDDFFLSAVVGPNSAGYLDEGLQPGSAYRYRIGTLVGASVSAYSPPVRVVTLDAADPPIPPDGPWLASAAVRGFQFKVRLLSGGVPRTGAISPACPQETLCISGDLPNRSEAFIRVIGPRPNGYFWPEVVRFTTAGVEMWARQVSSGRIRYYRLSSVPRDAAALTGLVDRKGFPR